MRGAASLSAVAPMPNRSNWPIASWRLTPITESTACSWTRNSDLRVCPSESNAPALISDSTTRLLQTAISDLSRKSANEV